MKTITRIGSIAFILSFCIGNLAGGQLVKWEFLTENRVYGKPLLSDNVVYIGSLDSNFYAIDQLTGTEIWHFKTADRIFTTAVIYDTIICFASGNHLIGLNIGGGLLWDFTMLAGIPVNEHDDWDNFNSSPLLVDSIAYVGCDKGHVFGVNVKTGGEVFHCQTPAGNQTIETKPAISGDILFFGDWDGVFYAYNVKTGQEVWEYDTRDDNVYSWVNQIQTDPVVYNGAVYFAGRSCNLYSLNVETGQKNWMYHDPSSMWLMGGIAIDDSIIYLGTSNQFLIQSFNAKTGDRLWSTKVDGRTFGVPYFDDNYVFFGTGHENADKFGSLYILDKKSGALLTTHKALGQVFSGPVVNDSVIYFGCADSKVYAVDMKELLDKKFPFSYLKDQSDIVLGELGPDQIYDTAFYIFNKGLGLDSLKLSAGLTGITISPDNFLLNPADSQRISININTSLITTKNYSRYISFRSFFSLADRLVSKNIKFTILDSETGIKENGDDKIPGQNYPNPFAFQTIISYTIDHEANVVLSVYNLVGQELEVLESGIKSPGTYSAVFNAEAYSEGIYLSVLKMDEITFVNKMVLAR